MDKANLDNEEPIGTYRRLTDWHIIVGKMLCGKRVSSWDSKSRRQLATQCAPSVRKQREWYIGAQLAY